MKAASSTRKKLLNPDGLFTEAGYTDALVALAAEMKAKREAKSISPTKKPSKSSPIGFAFESAPGKGRKVIYAKSISKIDIKGVRIEIARESRQESKRMNKKKAA